MKLLILLLLVTSIGTFCSAAETLQELRITEFVASNKGGIKDEDGDRSDWIEIWNASGISGELDGWYLTDDPAKPAKWQLPGSALAAGGRVTVFASGKNRAVAGSELHTSFRLQAELGGYLALVRPDGVTIASEFVNYPAQEEDISYGVKFTAFTQVGLLNEGASAWWLVPGGEIGNWKEVNFDDSAWSSGTTGIGYDASGDYAPHFGGGADLASAMRNVNKSVFIRVPFTVTDPLGNDAFLLRMKWEDGFAAYLNGEEITRQRAPDTLVWDSGSEPAGGRNETEAVTYFDYEIVASELRTGTNVLAIHGLNQSMSSSDFLISPLVEASKRPLNNFNVGHFPDPTPVAPNDTTRYDGLVADTKFSTNRGVFDTAFDLAITTATLGATIRYTTDGSVPSESNGTIYTDTLRIDQTTGVRAIAYRANFLSTDVDTHTYIFPADVVTQSTMRNAITGHPIWGPQMVDSINALPSLAITMPQSDINYTEIPISVELLNFENSDHQINAGARRVGGRFTAYAKRSFRLHFRSEYGAKRLNYPVFDGHTYPTAPVESFDALDVRAGNQDMIHRGAYLSNHFADNSMLAMGQSAPHGRFVHVYFNGNYRGMYYLRERFHASMLSDYSPGLEEDYTTIDATNRGNLFDDDGRLQNGLPGDWNQILGDLGGPTPYRDVRSRLDVPNLIDFMLLWTSGSCESEFRAVGSPANGVPFVFHMKDADGFLRDPDIAIPDPRNRYFAYVHSISHNGPINALSRMRREGDPDFEILVADRIHMHYFNDGVLTSPKHIARLQALVDEARLPYLAESARWAMHDGDTPARDPDEWEAYQENLLQNLFPGLPGRQINKLRAVGYYSDIEAPVFSQHGGSLPDGSGVVMTSPEPRIYYTLDGRDPRLPGGGISPAATLATFNIGGGGPQDFIASGDSWSYLDDASDQGTAWRASSFDDGTWSEGPSELGYGESDEATDINFVDTEPGTPGNQRNATSYFRKKVTIDDPAEFPKFTLELKYDDGAAIYINGNEVIRTANLPANAVFDTYSTGSSPDETAYFAFTLPSGVFVAGENTIAVEIHNASPSSGDLSFDLRLRGEDASGGNNITRPVTLAAATILNARSYDNDTGEWSALNSAFFSIDSIPANAGNFVISELHYHPAEPTAPEEIAVSINRDDYEFIEFLNIAGQPIELAGVSFTDGIGFAFADDTLLGAGERLVLVRDAEAFAARYGIAVAIAGEYSGRLSNGGERVILSSVDNGTIREFAYDDMAPWPTAPDGDGRSLILREPMSNPDHSIPENWVTNATQGGHPGGDDAPLVDSYASWKIANGVLSDDEDNDHDGVLALIEYTLGTSPKIPSASALPKPGIIHIDGQDYLTIDFEKNPFATDVIYLIQSSTDLAIWKLEDLVEISPGSHRMMTPVASTPRNFLRLIVQINP